jgi:hypothetical protein
LNKQLRTNLCEKICVYYKPAKREDIVCEGFTVIERLLRTGNPVVFDEPDRGYPYEVQKMLMHDMCTACPFYQNDCDFILSELSPPHDERERKRPLPCGGFMLLASLIDSRLIEIDDIRNII